MTGWKTSLVAILGLALVTTACGNGDAQDSNTETQTTADTQDTSTSATPPAAETGTPGTREMTLGDADAPVTMIEYASVTCPACAQFHQIAYPQLKEEYIDTGKVKLVFREFPTAPAQLAYLGSALARCAADKKGSEAYFAMLKTLFNNQQSWVSDSFQSELLGYAAQAGLSEEAFRTCIQRDDIIGAINDNVDQGRNVDDVSGTPSFYLNGEKMQGYTTYDDFFAMIDDALIAAGAEPPAEAEDTTTETSQAAPAQTPAAEEATGDEGTAEEE